MTDARPSSPPPRWWEGVASPGPLGYALAVLVSVVALAVLAAVVEATYAEAASDPASVLVGVALFGTVLALGIAPPGVLAVHLVTLRVRSQAVHVLVTGVVGLVAGLVVVRDLEPLVALLAVATAVGRATVVPLVPGVRRRRAERARRRAGARPVADFGATGRAG
ncbi:hypothetical protein [Nocardioides marmoraquaticus]